MYVSMCIYIYIYVCIRICMCYLCVCMLFYKIKMIVNFVIDLCNLIRLVWTVIIGQIQWIC